VFFELSTTVNTIIKFSFIPDNQCIRHGVELIGYVYQQVRHRILTKISKIIVERFGIIWNNME